MLLRCLFLLSLLAAGGVRADDLWVRAGPDGRPRIQLYFYWSLSCPHCEAARPHVTAIPDERPWVTLHEREVSRNDGNAREFEAIIEKIGAREQAGVPAFLFCGEMYFGWDGPAGTSRLLLERLDACRVRVQSGRSAADPAADASSGRIEIPLLGGVDAAGFSLPALTLVLAGLDAFNPCAFFVLLFLLSMMAHQKSRRRMLLIGGLFVAISGLMYFAFMAAWLNVFQLFGHIAWVTLAAGALAVFVGLISVKDFFWFEKGITLSIPESKKPDIFRRARAILVAEHLPAMLAATAFLAIAANFYELLCTAGFPMVYTRLLTLADLPAVGRYAYLAAYNLIYMLPLAAIVVVFARTLGARKLTEREGRLLKLMSGLMMLELGTLLIAAPERIGQTGIAFGLMAMAVVVTLAAARLTRESDR
ncbi:MAG: hypothetical protein OHM77_03680 [Candidatus Nitricoxidivorans perseverans]|uniref:Thioredoxin domain-containing protein n=1 Tax=Candidatus Nitricoxidivorans perseverans TaxID=2975601 RepID=A0AA49FM30_9PROT|nr:MAG: hypothetical protein OHM77_03680 [Candidatus Nitricoxidivorans perseverans]